MMDITLIGKRARHSQNVQMEIIMIFCVCRLRADVLTASVLFVLSMPAIQFTFSIIVILLLLLLLLLLISLLISFASNDCIVRNLETHKISRTSNGLFE